MPSTSRAKTARDFLACRSRPPRRRPSLTSIGSCRHRPARNASARSRIHRAESAEKIFLSCPFRGEWRQRGRGRSRLAARQGGPTRNPAPQEVAKPCARGPALPLTRLKGNGAEAEDRTAWPLTRPAVAVCPPRPASGSREHPRCRQRRPAGAPCGPCPGRCGRWPSRSASWACLLAYRPLHSD
jgi:hypothetical protein